MKILYIVSTLASSGPTKQLLNLIKYLDRNRFEPYLITLSPEPVDSCWAEYNALGVELYTLGLSRMGGVFFARRCLKELVQQIQPDLVHTQGLRADSLLASLNLDPPWLMTSRNYPPDDYPTKFGRVKGALMVRQHFSAMKRCLNLVACSKTIQKKLANFGIQSSAIQNGVRAQNRDAIPAIFFDGLARPIFISVGSLIPRKNMHFLVRAFEKLPKKERGSLVVLGDGPLMGDLRSASSNDVHFMGNVGNVTSYLAGADCFVSSSLSEGLPNTVLEALASGLPVILSNIESHQEIACESPRACKVFRLEEGEAVLTQALASSSEDFDVSSREDARRVANEVFSAEGMSARYQELYGKILEAQ